MRLFKINKKYAKKARDIRDNYPFRLGVMAAVLIVNLLILWGSAIVPPWYWGVVFIHTLCMPHITYYFSTRRHHESWNLIFDVTLYGFYLAAWGFNPFLAAVFVATSNLTLIALGGWRYMWISLGMQLLGCFIGVATLGVYFRAHLETAPMLVATFGFFVFMLGVGGLMHRINQRLHATRNDLEARHNDLTEINTLAMAVNSQLDIHSIIARLLTTLEKIYPLEAIYFIAPQPANNSLQVEGVYGEAISYAERKAFEALTFDLTADADSIFVMGLSQKRIINLPSVTQAMVESGAAIDRKLFDIKPCVSIIYFPVFIDEEAVGGLAFINHKYPCVLKKPELDRVSSYLIQVGTAIKNANLIRQLKHTKEQALIAQKKAEASEEAKSRFLANMSHEIRTPMTAILGYSEALQEDETTAQERKQFVDIIINSGRHLLSMINNILDISKIEASKVHIEHISIDIVHLIDDIENYLKLKTCEKNIAYSLDVSYPVPERITNDPTRLKQVLLNLCNNAIKFTEKGRITLALSWPQSHLLKIVVQDTGIGMSEKECAHIFDAFAQADTSTTRLYGGTGLGLTISKNLAILMGGDLELHSVKGEGSQFMLTIDVGANKGALIESPQAWQQLQKGKINKNRPQQVPALQGRVLIAEDNPVNQQIIKRLIEITGLKVDMVDNGLKALEAAAREPYDIAFFDMQMPVMGGQEAAKTLKEQGCTIPLVAFTANVMTHQVHSYLETGFIDIIEKPIDKKKLYHLLSDVLSGRKLALKTVMIVDDDEVNQLVLSRRVKKYDSDVDIVLAGDGQTAISLALATSVDLIFMDMEMPKVGGLEATRQLRANGFSAPIYMVTGNVDAEHKALCIAAGATGHLAKPIDKILMNRVLDEHSGLH